MKKHLLNRLYVRYAALSHAKIALAALALLSASFVSAAPAPIVSRPGMA